MDLAPFALTSMFPESTRRYGFLCVLRPAASCTSDPPCVSSEICNASVRFYINVIFLQRFRAAKALARGISRCSHYRRLIRSLACHAGEANVIGLDDTAIDKFQYLQWSILTVDCVEYLQSIMVNIGSRSWLISSVHCD
jgi:hypothetical protein